MNMLERLQSHFSDNLYFQLFDEVIEPAGKTGNDVWVVARSVCLCRYFDLSNLPQSRRKKAVEYDILRWNPFAESGYYVHLQSKGAYVWLWDKANTDQLIAASGITPSNIIPESILLGERRVGNDKPDIFALKTISGYDARIWQNGELLASQYWPIEPTQNDWQTFLRDNQVQLEHDEAYERLPIHECEYSKRVWTETTVEGMTSVLRNGNRKMLALALLPFLCIWSWDVSCLWQASNQIEQLESDIQQKMVEIDTILSARTRSLAKLEEINQMQSVYASPRQMQLMATVVNNFTEGTHLMEWHFSVDKLQFAVETAERSPLEYVNVYRKLEGFHEVTANYHRGKKQIMVTLTLPSMLLGTK